MNEMKIDKTQLPIFPHEIVPNSGRKTEQVAGKDSFVNVLKNKISTASPSIKFSAHAIARLASRNIILTKQDIAKINRAVMKMEEKGGKESLVVMGDLAF
ncbi:MAG: flagellar protein, partial [bacterium]